MVSQSITRGQGFGCEFRCASIGIDDVSCWQTGCFVGDVVRSFERKDSPGLGMESKSFVEYIYSPGPQ